MKREPTEPHGFIKPNGAGIPRLQAGEEVKLVCLRCGLERPLEPVAGPPEPYTRAVRALDMLADALDEDVMP